MAEPERSLPGLGSLSEHIRRSMAKRGWTLLELQEAVTQGARHPAFDLTAGAPATRYVHPRTGKSMVVNDLTGAVIHVGGVGFRYDPPGNEPPGV